MREGEYPHFIYRVARGRVHLRRTHEYGRSYIIADVGPGEFFGIPSVLEQRVHHYTAIAASEQTDCQLLSRESLSVLMNTDRHVLELLVRLLAGRVVDHSEQLVHQAYDSVRRRTALVLCDLHHRYGGNPIELSREELAQMVGTTKESVTRALSDFRSDGLLETEGRQIRNLREDALRELMI